MKRPEDAAFRVHVEIFALLRRLLPIGILAAALVGPLFVVEPSVAVWLSMALFCSSLFVLWTLGGLPLYPAHTFGVEYRVEDRPFDAERRRCVRCETVTDGGTHRRYVRQLVVLGVPIHTLAWGSNDFCSACLAADPANSSDTPADPTRSSGPAADSARNSAVEPATAPESEANEGTAHPRPDRGGAITGTEIARRVDLRDETTALEVRRAFDEADAE